MYKNINIPIIISIVSFVLMIVTSVIGNSLPSQIPKVVKITIISIIALSFLVFAFSIVPVIIWAVLKGIIQLCTYLKEGWQISSTDFRLTIVNFLIQNEERLFYVFLIFIWGIFIVGLAIALPAAIKEGFFKELFKSLE